MKTTFLSMTTVALLALSMESLVYAQNYTQVNLAASFAKGTVYVYNNAFQKVTLPLVDAAVLGFGIAKPFTDDFLPRDFVPFNVQAIGNNIVVTFALHQPGQAAVTAGPGLGFVDIFSSGGRLLNRLEHGDWLNAPWDIALSRRSTSVPSATNCSSVSSPEPEQPQAAEPSRPTILLPASSSACSRMRQAAGNQWLVGHHPRQ